MGGWENWGVGGAGKIPEVEVVIFLVGRVRLEAHE